MDPLSLGFSAVGIGLELFGGISASKKAGEIAKVQQGIAEDEQQINRVKQKQMAYEANRMQLQVFRNMQRQRALATAAAVQQGASSGSGLQGGLAQITDQSLFNSKGISDNLAFGNTIFGYNDDISQKKQQLSSLQSDLSTDQAYASLGGAMVKNAGTIGNLGQNVYSGLNNAIALFKPNSLSGG